MSIILTAPPPVLLALFIFVAGADAAGQAGIFAQTASEEFYDIYGPLPLPGAPNWPLYLGAAAVAVILVALIVYYLRRPGSTPRQQIQPHTEALAELAQARDLLEENASVAYAARASAILRQYIEQRFALSSTSRTTGEFLAAVEAAKSSADSPLHQHRQLLGAFLHQCDLAKYAGKTATRAQLEEMEHTVRRFIGATVEGQ